jgi:hypothetical protein
MLDRAALVCLVVSLSLNSILTNLHFHACTMDNVVIGYLRTYSVGIKRASSLVRYKSVSQFEDTVQRFNVRGQ